MAQRSPQYCRLCVRGARSRYPDSNLADLKKRDIFHQIQECDGTTCGPTQQSTRRNNVLVAVIAAYLFDHCKVAMSWRSEALRYSAESHPWLREHSAECLRFLGVLGNQSSWAHAMEHHALLVDALRLYCFKRSSRPLLNTRTAPPTPATMIDRPPYTWGALWNLPDVALVKAPLSAFFRPLYRPARMTSQSRGRYTRHPIVRAPPDVCKIVLADRSRISRRFVLLGPWTPAASFGAHANFGVSSRR